MTKEECLKLKIGDIIYFKALNGKWLRAKVNGKTKTWKRNPEKFQIPLKHGLYEYGYLTEQNMQDFFLEIPE